jgi:hypothetical protein
MKIRMAAAMLAGAQDTQCSTANRFARAVEEALPEARLLDEPLGPEAAAMPQAQAGQSISATDGFPNDSTGGQPAQTDGTPPDPYATTKRISTGSSRTASKAT